MKKIFIISAALFLAGYSQAQTKSTSSESPRVGIKGGLNVMKFAGDPDPKSEFNTGFSAGVFTNIPVSGKLSFEPSAEFSQKGAEYTFGSIERKSKISYIDLPLMAKYNVTPAFGLFAGPQVSFFVDSETKFVGNNGSTTIEDNTDNYRKSLAGGKIGASYNFGSIALNGSYATDLQEIFKEDLNLANLKNQVINVGLAYKF